MAEHESLADLYALARERGALIDLSDRAKWHLTGADRVRYLNGQITNNIQRVTPATAMTACVTTAKGRLSGVVYVSAGLDFLRIDSEHEQREPLAVRLERYIIADDAAIEDTTGAEFLFHILLPASVEVAPVIHGAEVRAATRFGRPGFDLIGPSEDHDLRLDQLSERYTFIPPALAETLRIEAGVPRWGAELTEETLPPEAGLDQTSIDYHKGCYIGQEVISRIKSVGHVNRHLAGFTSTTPLGAGMTLHPSADPSKSAGEITSAAWSFGLETWAALGYVKRGFAEATLLARGSDGATAGVQKRALPLVP